MFPPTPAAATNGGTNHALSMGAAADVEAVLIATRHRATGRERANEGRSVYREPGGPVRSLRVGLGVCEGQLSSNRGDNLRSIRLMLTRPFPPLYLISSEPPMLVRERNWIKASQASVHLSLSPFVPCTLFLSIVHFFPPPLLHDRSYLALGGSGWMEGWGDDIRK